MARKKVTKSNRKRAVKKPPGPPRKPVLANKNPDGPQVRTSMWLGEDLLRASAAEAARLGISRTLWVQMTLRQALRLPPVPRLAAPIPTADDNSVFG